MAAVPSRWVNGKEATTIRDALTHRSGGPQMPTMSIAVKPASVPFTPLLYNRPRAEIGGTDLISNPILPQSGA